MEEVPEHEQLVVLTNANVHMRKREKVEAGSKNYDILGAYNRDVPNGNGELQLFFATNHDLALATFLSTPNSGALHTFNGQRTNVSATS